MIKRGQVFVRAKSPSGRWHSADVLDLTQESFNAFVVGTLFKQGLVTGLRDSYVEGEALELYSTKEPEL